MPRRFARALRCLAPSFALLAMLAASPSAQASFLSGDALDTMANVLSWIVLLFVPLLVIVLFWLVHILPEVIAERRHHPQKDAIKTLCMLSLVFGGMLWPAAWLWAYARPVAYRLAYGTEKHEDYYVEMTEKARAGKLSPLEIAGVREELDSIAARGTLPEKLRGLPAELAEIERSRERAIAGAAAAEKA